ncbi:MAG TPA: hypothetical protein VFK97_02400 [Candidatus Saccharimonadales bacterium]|nr:hypothetical protein [Candidatus Saccharimonadales bacterium]
MRQKFRLILNPVSLVILSIIPSGAAVLAASVSNNSITSNGNGYRISPVVTNLTVNAGQSASVPVYLTDISTAPENLQVVIDDFQAKDETGTPALLLNGQSLPQHSLKQYTSLPVSTLALSPGQTKSLLVDIKIPANAVAGGYYGAVRFTPATASGQKNVNLAASVGSLILVKVPGNVYENVTITNFGVGRGTQTRSLFFGNNDLNAIVKFRNNGDVQEQPFGKIILKRGGQALASYEVNNTDPRGNVLPDSVRRFSLNLDKVGSFGKYTIEGNFGYGANGQLISASSTFYVVPFWLAILVIALILLIILGLFAFPRLLRRHDRRILRQAKRDR